MFSGGELLVDVCYDKGTVARSCSDPPHLRLKLHSLDKIAYYMVCRLRAVLIEGLFY